MFPATSSWTMSVVRVSFLTILSMISLCFLPEQWRDYGQNKEPEKQANLKRIFFVPMFYVSLLSQI